MRNRFPILLLLAGCFMLLCPTIRSSWNCIYQADNLAHYRDAVSRIEVDARQRLLEAAESQNAVTFLAVEESGIIGYVTIPALQIELPIYVGTDEVVLRQGAGLLEGSSLPLGGAGRHMVLSGHRGLPEARLFRDLDRLTIGDTFTVNVLDRVMTYQVDQILTVLPQDIDHLLPQEGEDLCTLLTCTPYGINTHRLLVRGRRTDQGPSA